MTDYMPDTSIRGPIRGTPDQWVTMAKAYSALRIDDVQAFATTVYDLSRTLHIRPEVILSAATLTTSRWGSYAWNTRCNFLGRDASKDHASKNFGDGRRAARAMMVHTWLLSSGAELPVELSPYRHLDVSWGDTIDLGLAGSVKGIEDFSHCLGIPWEAMRNILNDDLPFILVERKAV